MLVKDPEEDSSRAESEGPPWMWGKKHLHCKSVEEEEGRFCVCQRMKATNLEGQEEEFMLCAPFGLHLIGDVCGSSEGFGQGDAWAGLSFCCINLAAVSYAFEGNKT